MGSACIPAPHNPTKTPVRAPAGIQPEPLQFPRLHPALCTQMSPLKGSRAFFPPGKLPGCVRKGQEPPTHSQLSVIPREPEQVPLPGLTWQLRGSGTFEFLKELKFPFPPELEAKPNGNFPPDLNQGFVQSRVFPSLGRVDLGFRKGWSKNRFCQRI